MRKFLTLAAAVAMLALGSVNQVRAEDGATVFGVATKTGAGPVASLAAGVPVAMWLFVGVKAVYECATHKYDCTTSKVASADELRSERFASAGIDTSNASMIAVASNLGDENRAKLVADFNRSMGYTTENMAAVR